MVNLGCKVNRVESDDFAAQLLGFGMRETELGQADTIIVNTCTVTGEADKKTRKAVRQALRGNDHAQVVVTGCASAINPDVYASMDQRVLVVPKGRMTTFLEGFAPDDPGDYHVHTSAVPLRVGELFPTRVGVKVQDGCNNACTFCIVHVARGRATSRPADQVIEESRNLALAGVHEIVLTGINLGTYSYEEMRLAQLLEELLAACPDDVRFRISSIEPRNVDRDLIDLMASSNGRICRHLHLPLQSGSSKVLKEMARPYDAERFLELVSDLRAAMPSISLSTDVIVGFPGEDERDFLSTVDVARSCGFSKMHIFRYSMREGTPAALRADQIAPEVKAERAKRLEALEEELRVADLASRAGKSELALVEPGGVATTESYHTVEAPAGAKAGELVEVIL